MGDAIKYLYSQFILRDVLSFITPGAIVVFVATYLFYFELIDHPIHWLLFIPLFGVCYIVGFALHCFKEFCKFLLFFPPPYIRFRFISVVIVVGIIAQKNAKPFPPTSLTIRCETNKTE